MLATQFEEFINSLQIEDTEEETKRVKEITKRLNKSYYDDCTSETEHCLVVGSLGRETAIKTFSDIDMLFILPSEKKKEYDNCKGNGQSKLLQDVKKEIKKRYSKTIVRGDGQVVVVSFESLNKVVEVCPVFEKSDGSFTYPDSNNGGTWKNTNPTPEIDESISFNNKTENNFKFACHLVRSWRNNIGFKFGGLLIDTLVWKFFKENTEYQTAEFSNYLDILKDLFQYLKDCNEDQAYWYALGSNQKVYNKKCKFVKKAKKAYNKIKDFNEESSELYDALQDIFGNTFPIPEEEKNAAAMYYKSARNYRDTEQFVENKFNVDIRYSLKIDCKVQQNGFRDISLRNLLKSTIPRINSHRKLEFFIVENEYEEMLQKSKMDLEFNANNSFDYDIYWKVLNRGEIAKQKDCIRGQINRDSSHIVESADFNGEHVVECYIVFKHTVIARDKIKVPISISKQYV